MDRLAEIRFRCIRVTSVKMKNAAVVVGARQFLLIFLVLRLLFVQRLLQAQSAVVFIQRFLAVVWLIVSFFRPQSERLAKPVMSIRQRLPIFGVGGCLLQKILEAADG